MLCPSVQTFTVEGQGRNIPKIERAATAESKQVSRDYGTACATFGPDGWQIYLSDDAYETAMCGDEALACHAVNSTGIPYAVVGMGERDFLGRGTIFIHEVLEMLADPQLMEPQDEICDEYNGYTYKLDGIEAPVFVEPNGEPDRQGAP